MDPLLWTLKSSFRRLLPGPAGFIYESLPNICLHYTVLSGFLNGKRIRVLFMGREKQNRFYYRFLFDNGIFEKSQSGLFLPSMKGFFPLPDADIIVTQFPQSEAEHSLIAPSHIRTVLPIEGTFEGYCKNLKKSAQSSIRKIKRQEFYYEISSSESDFSRFYNKMYRPMIQARHADSLLCLDYPVAKAFFKRGFLLLVKKQKETLGGMLVVKQKKGILLKSLGILDGSFSYTKMGVNVAAMYFSIKHAFENGYEEVDFGIGSPFHTDGVLLFKSRWAPRIVQDKSAKRLYLQFKSEELKQRFYNIKKPVLFGEGRLV